MFYVFNTCKHFIRTFPNLVYDEKNVEDVDSNGEDHLYDAVRYVAMRNPIAPRQKAKERLIIYDPLDTSEQDTKYDRYDFYRRF
jgi:hypothetical protein